MSNEHDNANMVRILPGGTMRIGGVGGSQPDVPASNPEIDRLVEGAPLYRVNDNGALEVTEDGRTRFKGTHSIQITPSPQEQSIRNAEKDRDFKLRKLKGLTDENGNPKEASDYHIVEALKRSIAHINGEIELMAEVYNEQGAGVLNTNPSFAPGAEGGVAPPLSTHVNKGLSPSLQEIADDPDYPELVREKAARLAKRMRPRS